VKIHPLFFGSLLFSFFFKPLITALLETPLVLQLAPPALTPALERTAVRVILAILEMVKLVLVGSFFYFFLFLFIFYLFLFLFYFFTLKNYYFSLPIPLQRSTTARLEQTTALPVAPALQLARGPFPAPATQVSLEMGPPALVSSDLCCHGVLKVTHQPSI